MLPLSPNTTYSSALPVKSADLNDIQQMIVGRKHGAVDLAISGGCFILRGPNLAQPVPTWGDEWNFINVGPPNDHIAAGLKIEIGARINSITWHFSKGGSSASMIFQLRRRNGNTASFVDSATDNSNANVFTSLTRPNINYRVLPGDSLHLDVQATNTNHKFSHAVLSVQKD